LTIGGIIRGAVPPLSAANKDSRKLKVYKVHKVHKVHKVKSRKMKDKRFRSGGVYKFSSVRVYKVHKVESIEKG
jgi:hypothetical protein